GSTIPSRKEMSGAVRRPRIRLATGTREDTEDHVQDDTLVMVLAGGAGERLYPLTKERAKPAVYFGGPYRIIDFTLSNCINSGLRKLFIALQYKSLSLSRHLRLR